MYIRIYLYIYIYILEYNTKTNIRCLTNIAAGTSYETGQVIKNGVLDVLMTLLAHNPKDTPNNDLIEQIFWCFGNISGDCFYYTYLLLVQKKLLKFVFGKMLANNNHHFNISVLLQWCWVINNMFRKSSSSEGIGWEQSSSNTNADRDSNSNDIIEIDYYVPDEEEENFCEDVLQRQLRQCRTTIVSFLPNVLQLFQYLYHAFNNINDTSFNESDRTNIESCLRELLSALLFVSDDFDDPVRDWGCIELLCDEKVCSVLLSIVNSSNIAKDIAMNAFRVIGQMISSQNDDTTAHIIQSGFLAAIPKWLNDPTKTYRHEAMWTLSNIAAGSIEDIGSLLSNEELIKQVIQMALNDNFEIRREAAWVICNCFQGGSSQHIVKLIFQYNCLKPISFMLKHICTTAHRSIDRSLHDFKIAEESTLQLIVHGLIAALRHFVNDSTQLVQIIDTCDNLQIVDTLQDMLSLSSMDDDLHNDIDTLLSTFLSDQSQLD
ncbi:hypothetical protein RFI_37082 [Reticulomyxa filosa]|uniref:Importin subunit alpha n=1 Tax=Reticulomyxa filosa TaxID=46433 RepID=X6LI58_RETFI|nr:hypothetical protein RFI_37082 [Reticulomyxa filosa]|eukprot:ETO00365.1 hypothetical protein RFI_37082 [Reticulomyxa filosa]